MNNIKLSIIIPAYNAGNFITASLKSLLDQIIDRVEVILIDDGSSDNTASIVENNFSNNIFSGTLKVLSQENQGVSSARNFGVSKASGEYIGFMDSDDIILPGYVEKLLTALESDADIIEFGFKTFSLDATSESSGNIFHSSPLLGLHDSSKILDYIYGSARWYPWSRVFRASLFNDVKFPHGVRYCEDLMTLPLLYEKSKKIYALPDVIYAYRANPSGATFNVKPDYVSNLLTFYKSIPKLGYRRHDYLRMATSYAIYSCNTKDGFVSKNSTDEIHSRQQKEFRHLRYHLFTYFHCDKRRILKQLFPVLHSALSYLKIK